MSAEEFTRAAEFLNAGRADLAETLARRGLERQPESSFGHAVLSFAHTLSKRLIEAEREAREAIRLDPGHAFAFCALGSAVLDAGRVGDAEAAAVRALELSPLDWGNAYLLARVRYSQKRFQDCRNLLEDALVNAPDNPWMLSLRIDALRAQGCPNVADQEAKRLAAIHPEWAPSQFHLGWRALRQGDESAARALFLDALRQDPLSPAGRRGLEFTRRRWPVIGAVWAAGAAAILVSVLSWRQDMIRLKPYVGMGAACLLLQAVLLGFIRPTTWRRRGLVCAFQVGMLGVVSLIGLRENLTDGRGVMCFWAFLALVYCVVPFGRPEYQ